MSISSPTDIAGCQLWLAANAITGKSNGDSVTNWLDASGSGNHFVDPTSVWYPPTYRTNVVNGLPVVRFDAVTAQALKSNSTSFMSGKTAGEVFVVVKVNNDPPPSDPRTGFWRFSNATSTHFPYTDGVIYDNFGTANRKSTVNPTPSLSSQFRIYNVSTASGAWTSRIDGTQIYTTASNSVDWAGQAGNLSYIGTSISFNFDGDIAELFIYDSVLSSGDRADVLAYLNAKYFAAGTPAGSGTGTAVGTGTGAGATVRRGSGAGTGVGTGSGAGATAKTGSGTGAAVGTGTGAGLAVKKGSGTGSAVATGAGTGIAPAIVPHGTGEGVAVATATGAGLAVKKGSGTGTAVGTASGTGIAPTLGGIPSGSGTATTVATATGVGKSAKSGSGIGTAVATGVGNGTTLKAGSGTAAARATATGAGTSGQAANVIEFDAVICTVLELEVAVCETLDLTGAVMALPHVGDTGTKVLMRIVNPSGNAIDVTGYTVVIKMIRNGRTEVYPASLNTDGSDGKVYFLTQESTWDTLGNWRAQAYAMEGDSVKFSSKPVEFEVGRKY